MLTQVPTHLTTAAHLLSPLLRICLMEDLTNRLKSGELTVADFLAAQLQLGNGDYLSDDDKRDAVVRTDDEDFLLEGDGGGTPRGAEDNVAAAAAAAPRRVGGVEERKEPDDEEDDDEPHLDDDDDDDDEPRAIFGPKPPVLGLKPPVFGPKLPPHGGRFAGLVDHSNDDDADADDDDDKDGTASSGAESDASGARAKKKSKKPDEPPKLSENALAFINQNRAAPAACAGKRKSAVFTKRNKSGGRAASKKKNGSRASDVEAATLKKRVADHPNEGLLIQCGQLHCSLCHRNIGSASSAVTHHCKAKMHKDAKDKQAQRGKDGNVGEIKSAMDAFKANLPEGQGVAGMEYVPEEVRLFRAELIEVCGKAGMPLSKIDRLREFLEQRVGMSLSRTDHMVKTYLPVLTEKEKTKLRSEVKNQLVGVYHDGTTWMGEAFAIVVRWCTEDFTIPVRCVGVSWLQGSLDNTGISAELINTLSLLMGIPVENVIAWMHDCVSANLTSYNSTLRPTYHNSDDNGCLPHTLMHVGEKFAFDVLDELLAAYVVATSKSNMAKVLYKKNTGKSAKMKAKARWFTSDDVAQAFKPFVSNGALLQWGRALQTNKLCPASAAKIVSLLSNHRKVNHIGS